MARVRPNLAKLRPPGNLNDGYLGTLIEQGSVDTSPATLFSSQAAEQSQRWSSQACTRSVRVLPWLSGRLVLPFRGFQSVECARDGLRNRRDVARTLALARCLFRRPSGTYSGASRREPRRSAVNCRLRCHTTGASSTTTSEPALLKLAQALFFLVCVVALAVPRRGYG